MLKISALAVYFVSFFICLFFKCKIFISALILDFNRYRIRGLQYD